MAHRIAAPSCKVVNAVAHLGPRAAPLRAYLLAAIDPKRVEQPVQIVVGVVQMETDAHRRHEWTRGSGPPKSLRGRGVRSRRWPNPAGAHRHVDALTGGVRLGAGGFGPGPGER